MAKQKFRKRAALGRRSAAPTKERQNNNGGVTAELIDWNVKRYRAIWECPLDAYRDHKIISATQYQAGLRFHFAYYGAVLCRHQEFRPTSHDQASMEPAMCDRQLHDAYKAIEPNDLEAVIDICGYSKPARTPRALESLRKGLGHLALHWHMAAIETCEPATK